LVYEKNPKNKMSLKTFKTKSKFEVQKGKQKIYLKPDRGLEPLAVRLKA
jgi:hypothetical protein